MNHSLIYLNNYCKGAYLVVKMVKNLLAMPEKSHGQRSLEGYSPWGHKESDTTERISLSPT